MPGQVNATHQHKRIEDVLKVHLNEFICASGTRNREGGTRRWLASLGINARLIRQKTRNRQSSCRMTCLVR